MSGRLEGEGGGIDGGSAGGHGGEHDGDSGGSSGDESVTASSSSASVAAWSACIPRRAICSSNHSARRLGSAGSMRSAESMRSAGSGSAARAVDGELGGSGDAPSMSAGEGARGASRRIARSLPFSWRLSSWRPCRSTIVSRAAATRSACACAATRAACLAASGDRVFGPSRCAATAAAAASRAAGEL